MVGLEIGQRLDSLMETGLVRLDILSRMIRGGGSVIAWNAKRDISAIGRSM